MPAPTAAPNPAPDTKARGAKRPLRVAYAGQLQIGRHGHLGQRHESDARIVHLAREQFGDRVTDLLTDAVGPVALCHISEGTPLGGP